MLMSKPCDKLRILMLLKAFNLPPTDKTTH